MNRVCPLFLGLLFLLIGGITHAIECPAGYEGLGTEKNCRDIDECTEIPGLCGNKAVCKNTKGSYFCTCKDGFAPSNGKKTFKADQQVTCEVNQFMCTNATVADIVMLIDGSWSIGRENFKIIRKFLEKVVNAFDVGIDKVRIGLVEYSGDPKAHWHLNSYTTKDEVINAIRNLPYKGGNTMTGLALTFIQKNSFRLQSGSRENVSKIAILVTDGKSQDDIVVPAQSLRDAGVELFAIGVKNANEKELKLIASKPDETHVYNVADFGFLFDILDGLTSNVCDAIKGQKKDIRRVKNADEELKVVTSKPDETHVYNFMDFSTINTVTEGLTRNVCDAVKQQEEKIRSLEQMRIFCLKKHAEEP